MTTKKATGTLCATAVTFILQVKIGDEDWHDRHTMPTAEEVMARVGALNKGPRPHPLTQYRGIIRVTSDHLLPNAPGEPPAREKE